MGWCGEGSRAACGAAAPAGPGRDGSLPGGRRRGGGDAAGLVQCLRRNMTASTMRMMRMIVPAPKNMGDIPSVCAGSRKTGCLIQLDQARGRRDWGAGGGRRGGGGGGGGRGGAGAGGRRPGGAGAG